MARKKATAEATTAAPKKRASRKKAEAAAPEAELEVTTDVEDEAEADDEAVEAEAAASEVEAVIEVEPAPEPEPKKAKSKPASRRKEKAAPARSASAIEALIPPVSLALVDDNASLPGEEAVAEAFTAFYAAALERMRYALVTAAAPPPPPAAPPVDAPPPLSFEVPADEEVVAAADWELAVDDAFEAPPEVAEEEAPSVFDAATDGAEDAFGESSDVDGTNADGESEDEPGVIAAVSELQEEEGAAGVLFDEALEIVEESPEPEPEPADEATVNFDPTELVGLIDADEAPAAETDADDTSAETSEEAPAEEAPAEEAAAAAPRKSRKSKRKR